jgi:hypothetical protein
MYLNIQVLGTYMSGIYIQLSLQVCTVSIKLSITRYFIETVFNSMCVCVCVYLCIYVYVYIYMCITSQHICICISEFIFVPDMQNCSDMYHDACTQYLFTVVINKVQMCSSQFNLTRMFLNSLVACFLGLMILFHLLVNCLRVV